MRELETLRSREKERTTELESIFEVDKSELGSVHKQRDCQRLVHARTDGGDPSRRSGIVSQFMHDGCETEQQRHNKRQDTCEFALTVRL